MTKIFNSILKVFGYIMPILYVVVGLVILFTDFFGKETLKIRLALGILLVAYGVFRAWRIFKNPDNQTKNEDPID